MTIVVCVKQVPDTDQIAIDEEKGTLIRAGVPAILNPFCEYALDEAVRLKKQYPETKIIALTLGPPQAREILQRCLELGADEAIHLCDGHFAGSDCLATAYVISTAINEKIGKFDLILTGKQAIDGDTAQVPGEVAELLNLDQVNYALQITTISETTKKVVIHGESEQGYVKYQASLPLLVTISGGSNIRRFPSLTDIFFARSKSFLTISRKELRVDNNRLGLKGSPTQVVKITVPGEHKGGKAINYKDNSEQAIAEIVEFLKEICSISGK